MFYILQHHDCPNKMDTKLQYSNNTTTTVVCVHNTDGKELQVQSRDANVWQEVHIDNHKVSSTGSKCIGGGGGKSTTGQA
jgi:hypothetical protein